MNFFCLTLRWSSALLGLLVAGLVLNGEPPSYEALAILAPLAWADRTVLTWIRGRRI